MRLNIPESAEIVGILEPAADAGGRTSGVFANIRNYTKAWLVFFCNQGNAATIAITPKQGNTAAGGGAAVMPAMEIYTSLDHQTSPLVWTRQTKAANYTTDAGVKKKVVIFEIDPVTMDTDNGFNYLGITTGASNAANITSAFIVGQKEYEGSITVNPLV